MKKIFYLTIIVISILFCSSSFVSGQGVSINASGNNPDPSALLDISSTSKGALLPRMSTSERDAIPANCSCTPAEGLIIFNTTTKCLEMYLNSAWFTISCPANCLPPSIPVQIYGNSSVSENATGEYYYIDPVDGATSYTWVVPSGATITSGQGTTSIYVDYTCVNGDITVSANNSCGSSTQTLNVSTYLLTPDPITGPTSYLGAETGVVYSIPSVPNALSYTWTVPSGASIASGQGTESITVDFTCSANGNITVVQNTNCGPGPAQAITVSTNLEVPGPITGPTSGLAEQTGVTYSISSVPNAVSYTWSVPSGATIASGQGTISITVDFSCSASGDISVVENGAVCGSSAPQTLSVVSDVQVPGPISGPNAVTNSSTATYSISSMPNATSYTWTVTLGTINSGQGSTSISVTWDNTTGLGTVSVVENTSCGASSAQTLQVGINILQITTVGTTTWTPPLGVTSVEVLVVAGGGGGGGGNGSIGAHYSGGGGGAGGLIYNASYAVSGPVSVVIGGGGAGHAVGDGDNGQNSSFGTLVAIGGGGGGKYNSSGKNGGSGGGAGRDGSGVPGSGTAGQGFAGGTGTGNGGGGAGQIGGTNQPGYQGGDGLQYSISGVPTYYAGGGGGSQLGGFPNYGGLGGGGQGNSDVVSTPGPGGNGQPNTGGGGGASGNGYAAGSGGSGVVILRW